MKKFPTSFLIAIVSGAVLFVPLSGALAQWQCSAGATCYSSQSACDAACTGPGSCGNTGCAPPSTGAFPGVSPIQSEADVVDFFNSLANWLLGTVGMIAVLALLYSGFLFMTAGGILQLDEKKGDPERLKQAKNWLKWGIVGIIIVVLSRAMVSLVASFLV